MLRVTLRSVAGLLLLVSCAALAAAADEKAEKSKRIAYDVKYGSAKDLAKVLGEHLKGVAEVEALPEASANVLLIRATPAAFGEVVKLLEVLDRRPRMVAVEVWVAEVLPGQKKDEPLDTKGLNGSADDVRAKVEELRRNGRIGELKRLELTAVENQPAHAFVGQNTPITLGIHVTATGLVSRNITYSPLGADVQFTPRVGPDNLVTLDLKVGDSYPYVGPDSPVLGYDENKAPVRAVAVVQAKGEAKVSVPSGQAVLVRGVTTTAKAMRWRTRPDRDEGAPAGRAATTAAKAKQLQTLVIVTARVLDGTPKEKEGAPPPPRP